MIYIGAVFLLGALVAIHEFGHFIAGRMMGIPISVFSIGFGPRVAGFQWAETDVRLSMIPLGGYVMPAVEDADEFLALGARARIIFALGGPAANILAAIPIIAMINVFSGDQSIYALLVAPWLQAGIILKGIILAIPMIFAQPENISSVAGIAHAGGQFISAGLVGALKFAAIISLNLAVFNMLPLPPLDGGKIVLDIMERLHPKLSRAYVPACVAGWIAMIGLMLYATVNDVARLAA